MQPPPIPNAPGRRWPWRVSLQRARIIGQGRIARQALGTLLLQGGSIALRLALGVVLARLLGAEKYGVYSYVTALVLVLHVPAALGLPQLMVREVSLLSERKAHGLLHGLLKMANRAVLLTSALVSLGLFAWSLWQGGSLESQETASLWVGLVLLPILSLAAIFQGALQGFGHILVGQVALLAIQPGLLLALALLIVYVLPGASELTATQTVALHTGCALVALGASFWFLLQRVPESVRGARPTYHMRPWLRAASPFFGLAALTVLSGRIDIVMVGWFRAPEEVGIYRAAVTAGAVVTFGLEALNVAIAPRLVRMWENRELRSLQVLATQSAWAATLFALPFFALFALAGEWALGLAFGPEFAAGSSSLFIIGAGQLVNAAFGSVSIVLNMTGHQRWTLIGLSVASVVNLGANAWLIPRYGIEGAAIASTMALAAWKLILFVQVRRVVGVDASLLGIFRRG